MQKKDPLSILRIAIGFLLVCIQTVIFTPLFLIILPSRHYRIRLGNLYGKIVAPLIFLILGVRFNIKNKERLNQSYPAIYLSNHSSQLDPLIAIKFAPFGACGIAKKEIASIPFFGWSYLMSGHLLIDRSDRKKAIASLKELNLAIKKMNLGVWIWPEGTRSRDGRLLTFKKGFAHIAIQTGLPIVPIVIADAHKRWPSKSMKINAGEVHMQILEPISTENWTTENLSQHIEDIRNIFLEHLPKEQRPIED
jgi:lysophosphatidate acyltransferase